MRVRVPVLIKDPDVSKYKGVPLFENFYIKDEDVFLDGPISRRVAVLDFDPETGKLSPGARYTPPHKEKEFGRYTYEESKGVGDPAFLQSAVFGGVHKTLAMFEESDALGRRVDWAFDGPQLLVVPRAGDWANAFYDRESRSLQFFFFTPDQRELPVFTAHSQDIIAHETAHAIIDGVVPDLYDAASPESLAIHESIADIATLLMSFRSRQLREAVLRDTGDSISGSSAFTGVAGQFGAAINKEAHSLRELKNAKTMKDVDDSEPHALSQVLSGAIYAVVVGMYEESRTEDAKGVQDRGLAVHSEIEKVEDTDGESAEGSRSVASGEKMSAGKALFIAAERLKRTVIRGLDYLPPGEASFRDFGRAVLASDEASHPDSVRQRVALANEFVRRGIASSIDDLKVRTNYAHSALKGVDLDALLNSDWSAYRFAEKARDLLNIPKGVAFTVRPRLDVKKTYYHRGEEPVEIRELLFKVSWNDIEASGVGGGLPDKRRVTRGTTLAIDWEKRLVRAVLTTDQSVGMRHGRDKFIAKLLDREAIAVGGQSLAPDGRLRRGVVPAEITDGALRIRSVARTLHLLADSQP